MPRKIPTYHCLVCNAIGPWKDRELHSCPSYGDSMCFPKFELCELLDESMEEDNKDLNQQFIRIHERFDQLFVKLAEEGPGQIECPKCGAVRKTGGFVFRPGDNYTVCPHCHAKGLIKVIVSWHDES